MTAVSDDAARLRSLLEIAKLAGAARSEDDLLLQVATEVRSALDAAAVRIEPFAEDGPADDARLLVQGHELEVPVVVEGRTWGEVRVTRPADRPPFEAEDVDFLLATAGQVAAGINQTAHLARIERLAFEDPLTGLANRRAVDDRLEAELAAHLEDGRTVAVVLADINRLKQVNDSLGHEAGDRLIISVAGAVKHASAQLPGSLAARIGGDEFCLVSSGYPESAVVTAAHELCRLVDAQPMSTGVACGLASTELDGIIVDFPARLLRLADAAQYRAKRSGAGHPVVAGSVPALGEPPGLADRRSRRGRLAALLPMALQGGLEILDAHRRAGVVERLEAVAEHISGLADAAGWWVSHADLVVGRLVTVSTSVQRSGAQANPRSLQVSQVGASFELADYPESERVVREAGSFVVELGEPGNDPAEEKFLVTAGYSSVLAAGAAVDAQGWLVEIYGDLISRPVIEVEPVLRALVALAVVGADDAAAGAREGIDGRRPGRTSDSPPPNHSGDPGRHGASTPPH